MSASRDLFPRKQVSRDQISRVGCEWRLNDDGIDEERKTDGEEGL